MRAIDGNALFNTWSATGDGPVAALEGGYYELSAVATTWNGSTLQLEQLMPDGSTYFARTDLKLTANGVAFGYVSAGTYKLTVTAANPTALKGTLSRVPTD